MCLKGKKDKAKREPGNFLCDKCDVASDKKKDLCKPSKIKDDEKAKKKSKKK